MTPTLLNGGKGHVDSGCTHLRASCAVASCTSIRSTEPLGRCGGSGAHHG
jgi:hypothetical protein